MTWFPAESVRPRGFHTRIGRPSTSHDHGPDSHGCGEDNSLWNVSHWACSCHSDRSASGTNGKAVSGFCWAHALPCEVSPRNQPVNEDRYVSTGTVASAHDAPGSPRRIVVRVGLGTPASRQAARSQNSERTAKKARNHTPLHFTAQAQPNRKPAAIRHPRGPIGTGTPPMARTRARTRSRSTTRQATAETTNTCRKTSSRPIRDSVKEKPSSASSSPARSPRNVEPVSRRASRTSTTTAIVPATAEENRQPREL